MDDLTATDFPYSPIPPGQQFDTPFELNQTSKVHKSRERERDLETHTDAFDKYR